MKALVTGVAGFIGSHIAERLIVDGQKVVGIDDLSAGYINNVPKDVQFVKMDVCKITPEILEGVDTVFHNAASKKNICLKNPIRDMEVNGIGTLHLLQECVKAGVYKFVHASTGSVYGEVQSVITERTPCRPVSYYGISKLAGESYVKMFGGSLNITILRYFHVYGERQESRQDTGGVVSIFCDKIQKGEGLIVHGNGGQERVFTYVKDIVEANIESARNPVSSGKVYNCASSVKTTINELANMLMRKYNKIVPINYIEPLVGDIYNFNVDNTKIGEIGVEFRPITDVLCEY